MKLKVLTETAVVGMSLQLLVTLLMQNKYLVGIEIRKIVPLYLK